MLLEANVGRWVQVWYNQILESEKSLWPQLSELSVTDWADI